MENNTCTISRKFTIIPTLSDIQTCNDKIYKFTIEKLESDIRKYETYIKNTKKNKKLTEEQREKKLEKHHNDLKKSKETLKKLKETNELTDSMANDYAKSLVKDAMESEARRKNYILS